MQRRNKTGKRTQSKCRTYEEQAGSANTLGATTFRQFSSECRWNSGGAAGGASGSSLKSRPHPPSFSSLPSVVTWRPVKQVHILEHDRVARPDTASSLVCMYVCMFMYIHARMYTEQRPWGKCMCQRLLQRASDGLSPNGQGLLFLSHSLFLSVCVSLSHTLSLSLSLSLGVCVCVYVCMSVFIHFCFYRYIRILA